MMKGELWSELESAQIRLIRPNKIVFPGAPKSVSGLAQSRRRTGAFARIGTSLRAEGELDWPNRASLFAGRCDR
jgi:hypothetical protein